jgi:hypothetical protein
MNQTKTAATAMISTKMFNLAEGFILCLYTILDKFLCFWTKMYVLFSEQKEATSVYNYAGLTKIYWLRCWN